MVLRVYLTNIERGGGTGGEREGDILLEYVGMGAIARVL